MLTLWWCRIGRDEGIGGFFAGCGPTVVRAMALNCGMLASNDQVSFSAAFAWTQNMLVCGFYASALSVFTC